MERTYVDIQTADKHIKYDHQKPAGVAQIIFCIITAFLLMFVSNALFVSGGPNLLLVFVFLIATKGRPGLVIAFSSVSGFMVDLVYGRYLGFYGFLFTLVAVAVIPLKEKLDTKPKVISYAVPVFFAFNLSESLLTRILAVVFGGSNVFYTSFGMNLLRVVLPGFLWDMAAVCIMIFPVYAFWRRLTPH